MQTLESNEQIKDYFCTNIIANLPKVNITQVILLNNKINFDVEAKSENLILNENFNQFIKTIKAVDEEKIDIPFMTRFFFYYQRILKILKIPFPVSSSK